MSCAKRAMKSIDWRCVHSHARTCYHTTQAGAVQYNKETVLVSSASTICARFCCALSGVQTTLTDLAEAPFHRRDGGSNLLRDAMTQKQRLEQLELSDTAFRDQVAHLQHSLKSQHLELQALKRENEEARTTLSSLRLEHEKLASANESTQRANTLLRERLALYAGGAGLQGAGAVIGTCARSRSRSTSASATAHHATNTYCAAYTAGDALAVPASELERALTLVRRRLDRPSDINEQGLIVSDTAQDGDLKRRLQQLQVALLTAQGEIDRYERMMKAQGSISQDLAAEVTSLSTQLAAAKADGGKALADTQALAEQRLQRIQMLEAQVSQLLQQAKSMKRPVRRAAAAPTADASQLQPIEEAAPRSMRLQRDDDASTVISELSDDAEGAITRQSTSSLPPPQRARVDVRRLPACAHPLIPSLSLCAHCSRFAGRK